MAGGAVVVGAGVDVATMKTPDLGGSPDLPPAPAPPRRRGRLAAFLDELRRRRVIRSLVVYGTLAFAILQVVEPVMHGLHLPEWVLSAVVVLLGLGFPLTTGLAWVFDLKTTGVERTPPAEAGGPPGQPRGARLAMILLGIGLVLAAPGIAYHFAWGTGSRQAGEAVITSENPLAGARYLPLTSFDGIEQAAALSRDGRFAAFQSDREGAMDVWVTQVGTGQFFNLTRGTAPEIANPSIRTLGFSPDGTLVTFWGRRKDGAGHSDISIWAIPLLGGEPRPYLDGVAEFDWSADGARLAYHTPGPGDPMYVRDAAPPAEARLIHAASDGLHAHYLVWAPDRSHVYYVEGTLPDRMDIWRVRPNGGTPEQVTHHDSRVSHPVFLDARTLLYLATDPDGFGPWIYALDAERPVPRRISFGVDGYTSLAASADGRRLVVTVSSPKSSLWRVPFDGHRAQMSGARRIPLTTGAGSFPRSGPGFLLYVSSKGTSDSLWKLRGTTSTEIWSSPETRIVGAPAISRDGQRIAFSARRGERTVLYAVNSDGSNARIITRALEPRGSPAWAPDGQSITVAAAVGGVPRLFKVPLDGGAPTSFVNEHASDPVWSPQGDIVAFSGADVGTTYPIRAVTADGGAITMPALTLTRGARHLTFLPQRRTLLVMRGEIAHKDLWRVDLETGSEQQVTELAPDFVVRDFDLSPDGRELLLERVQEHSDVVLVELAGR
jgi:Tol biopolymer transport system component